MSLLGCCCFPKHEKHIYIYHQTDINYVLNTFFMVHYGYRICYSVCYKLMPHMLLTILVLLYFSTGIIQYTESTGRSTTSQLVASLLY